MPLADWPPRVRAQCALPPPPPVPGTLYTYAPTHPAEELLSPQSGPGKEVQSALWETPSFSSTSDIRDGTGVHLGQWGPRPA